MFSAEDFENYKDEHQADRVIDVQSLLSVGKTMQYQQEQSISDKALNVGKSLYNGAVAQTVGGTLKGLQWLRDVNEAQLNAEHPERQQMDESMRNLLDDAANADFLKPYEVQANSGAERFVYDLTQGAGQLAGQVVIGAATGGYGNIPAMALQIGGEEYRELREQGVDVETAGTAAAINAAVQTPLEYLGFSKIAKAFPANTMMKQRVRLLLEDAITEGVTEFAQEYPEQISKLWALNADKTPEEIMQIVKDNINNMSADALYSGTIGAILGSGAGGLHIALDRNINRAMAREAHSVRMDEEINRVEKIKQSEVNPAYAAAVINDNMQNETVYVDGGALYGYAQEKGAEKVAESLGVSVEDIEKAAAEGDTIDIKLGNYEATGAAFDGFIEAVKDDTAFDDGGYTPNKENREQALARAKERMDAEVRTELDRLEGELTEAAKAAGIKADVTNETINLLSRASMTGNPVEFLKKLSFRYGDTSNGYAQFAGENAETADSVKLEEAQRMEENGAAADEIYKKTGWFKGIDNRWRFEIADDLKAVNLDAVKKFGEMPLARVYYNKALFDAYPILRTVKIKIDPNMDESIDGEADVYTLEIALNEKYVNNADAPETVMHEIAHLIQKIEGFAAGGAPGDVRNALKTLGKYKAEYDSMDDNSLYRRIGGEQEAREVERRARLEQSIASINERIEKATKNGDDEEVRRATFAKTLLERQREQMPKPHTADAVIVFDGDEMPYAYAPKQVVDSYAQNQKGVYNPETNIITLFKGADASTVIHETWHFFVEQMWQSIEDGTASEQTIKDFNTLLNYSGMTLDEWTSADMEGRRAAHERLAEAGETYIMEGKAPSLELRRVFDKFAKWLKEVYRTLQRSENYTELTDEVREVFDRMLAAEDDIAHMERVNGYFAKLPDVITENMSDATRRRVEDYIDKARDKAVDILTRRALKNYTKERREEVKKFKEEIRPSVEEEVSKRRVYACGYDKSDAARFRKLQDQKAGLGVWTEDDFIDRSFPPENDVIANEVAHMAVAVNPKNWKKGLAELKADYQRQADEILKPALDALNAGMGQGVEVQQQEGRDGRGIRVSKNAPWYQEFYKEHKRKPNNAELREMARQLISGDVNAPKVEGWTPTTAEVAQSMKAEGERLADIERHIEACDAIKDKIGKVEGNYKETSSAGSEGFLLQADLTAERYGYSSADEMMKDIETSPTKAKAVNQRINERVEELSSENEKENYTNAIREALYNEDEALLIGVEQQLIEDYAAKAKERQEAQEQKAAERKEQAKISADVAAARKQQAKNAARADLANMNIKEATRTNKFITAERRAAAKCAELLAKKKFDEALTQKNLQAYWHAMAAESLKIARRQKQYEKFLKTQVKLKQEAWLNDVNFAAISQLFVRMGIAREVHKKAAAESQYGSLAAYADAMEQLYDCVDIAPWILDESIPLSDTNALTLEQYEDVVNAVKNIKAIVKAQKGVNMFSTQEAWAGTKANIMGMLAPLKTLWEPDPNKVSKPSKTEQWLAGLETMDTVCEMLDGGRYGWFSQHWNNLMKRCQDAEYDHRKAYDDAETEAYKKWVPDEAAEAAANEEVYYEELGTSVTKHTLVRMLMNLGNKENSQRICETVPVKFDKSTLWVMPDEGLAANQKELRAMREEAREATRKNLIDFLGKVLTEEDVKYAQRRINAMEMFWGERVELDKRTKGFAPKKVEATPVLLDIGGKQVVLQGGYCPLLRYGETGSHSAAQEVNEDDPLQGKNIRTYHTNTSSSKARTNARYPVDLRLGTERNWIYESIHDICWREAMTDFRRVLNDQELFGTLKSKMGLSRMNLFKELLEVSADGRNSKPLSEFEKSISDTAGWLTSRITNALVMCSLKISSQNLADCLLYGNAVEGYTMADNISALGRYMLCFNLGKWKEMQDFVFSKSAYMEERSLIPDVTIRDMMADEKEKKWQKVLRETTTKMFALTDNATAIPNWMQAYNKKINEGWAEQDAIDFADAVVRRVKGSSRNTEISSMQRSKVLKPITMFQSFFNARFNEFVRMERYATNQWTDGQKAEAFSTVASYVMAKVIAQAMLALAFAAENPFGIDDEDKWPNLIKELKSQTFSMFGPIGQAASAAVGAAAGMREFDYRMSAIESTVNKGIGAIRAVRSDKKTAAEKVEAATNFATLVSGAPMQITKVFWNLFDIAFNNMTPEVGDIMRRRPKKERK